jgi:predicted RNA-binding Zn ribbon-like protein
MRKERKPSPSFELSGGALCLDFVNTWGDRARPETDRLLAYPDLLAFALQAGLLGRRGETLLARRAERNSPDAAAALALACSLREALYRILSSVAASRAPAAADLGRLNAALPEALSHLRLARRGTGIVWTWAAPEDAGKPEDPENQERPRERGGQEDWESPESREDPENQERPGHPEAPEDAMAAPLWPILWSAAELLTSDEREQVRECAGSACTWLFLDRSRNRSRRWCSMQTCGNRAKARRHYGRRGRSRRMAEREARPGKRTS